MAVPKKKMSKSRSRKRTSTWVYKKGKKILNSLKLTQCKSCGATMKLHNVCRECGYYRGKKIISPKLKTITGSKKVTSAKV